MLPEKRLVPAWLMVDGWVLLLGALALCGLAAAWGHWTSRPVPKEAVGLLLTGWTFLQTEWLWRADSRYRAAVWAAGAFGLSVYLTARERLPLTWQVDPDWPTLVMCLLWLMAMYRLWVELPRYALETEGTGFRMEGSAWPMPAVYFQDNIYRFGREQRGLQKKAKNRR